MEVTSGKPSGFSHAGQDGTPPPPTSANEESDAGETSDFRTGQPLASTDATHHGRDHHTQRDERDHGVTTDEMTVRGTDDTVPPAAPPQAQEAPMSRRERELLRVEIQRERDAARLAAQQARFSQAQAQRQARAEQRREERADKQAARADMLKSLAGWIEKHQTDLLIAPLIVVPAWLGWEAMSGFGAEFWAGSGQALPVISECGMWAFSFAIARERKKNPNSIVWPFYLAMFVFAGICAGLNAAHGFLGPLPGTIPPGPLPAGVYAVVSVSGLFAHQIMALSGRVKVAKNKAAKNKVARRRAEWWPPKLAKEVAIPGGHSGHGGGRPGGQADGRGGKGLALPEGTAPQSGADGASANSGDLARGDKTKRMRDYWDAEISKGRIPSGADLNEAAGNKRSASLGTNNLKKWRAEPEAQKIIAAQLAESADGETAP